METFVDEKSHARPSHDALNTDKEVSVTNTPESEAEKADQRMNEIANKAASKGMNRQHQDDREIFTK